MSDNSSSCYQIEGSNIGQKKLTGPNDHKDINPFGVGRKKRCPGNLALKVTPLTFLSRIEERGIRPNQTVSKVIQSGKCYSLEKKPGRKEGSTASRAHQPLQQ
ncbi:hypothetical protein RUM44_012424 [Polyplax serrata]|uniref:Uncharacterized protein n=1 Tax=Polyplax serrata TaxID=468196 RepID=A0ABR1BF62_POLSC